MREPGTYRGREQTYLKHFFLEHYLETVAYHIGWANPEFVYVDGFSGPWHSEDERLGDTSFMIAIEKLRSVRRGLAEYGRHPRVRCIFVEQRRSAFEELRQAIRRVNDIEVVALNGAFELLIPDITRSIRSSFALVLIDPTGWRGFALERIAPLLRCRGEILINFMFDHVNRFLDGDRVELADSFDSLFGGPGWRDVDTRDERALLDYYQSRLKQTGDFEYVTRTRILKPLRDRTYFYLVYATRHPKGLLEFRRVEAKLLDEQERVRAEAKQESRIASTRQPELFRAPDAPSDRLREERLYNQEQARRVLLDRLRIRGPLEYDEVLPALLELPMIDESTAKRIMESLRTHGVVAIDGMKARQRLPDRGCVLSLAE